MSLALVPSDPRANPDDYDRDLGRLALLGATTRTLGRAGLSDAVSVLHGALMSGQYRIYLDARGRPVAALVWAMLDAETAEAYLETGRLPDLAAWKSGPDLWLLHVIAEGGPLKQVLGDIAGPLFAGHHRAFVLRPSPGGGRRVVTFTRRGAHLARRLPPATG